MSIDPALITEGIQQLDEAWARYRDGYIVHTVLGIVEAFAAREVYGSPEARLAAIGAVIARYKELKTAETQEARDLMDALKVANEKTQ